LAKTVSLSPATRIYLATGATDLRKSFEGLSDLVTQRCRQDPLSGHLFLFVNHRRNRLKLLYGNGTGVCGCAKRLGRGGFAWPKSSAPGASQILASELPLLLSGIDLDRTRTRPWWRPAAGAEKKWRRARESVCKEASLRYKCLRLR
jgi:transposase